MNNILIYLCSFFVYVILQSLFINGVKELFNEDMLLYKIRLWADKKTPTFLRKILYGCIRCMGGLYGVLTFMPVVVYIFGFRWEEIFVQIFDIGILIYLNYYFYKRQ